MANRPEKIGKYPIADVIGEGGMGAVYKANHPDFGAPRAIKVIKGDFAENPELLRRFYQEAQAVGNLHHPNIVVVHDLGEENGSPFLVMEYVDGIPLDKIIARRQSLSLLKKLGIVIEVLNALHYAHQHNIVHRDVKPANVMVLQDDHIKLLDFGIARQGDLGQTKTNQMMGTMYYMSPEQFEGKTVDGRSDVFSTGIMLYELLAYTLPFSTTDMSYVMRRMRGDAPPPLSTYLQSYPPELDDIIARSLALRDDRYSTAEDFAFDLGRIQYRLRRDLAGERINQARDLIERRDLPKACELLSEAVRLDTENQTAKQLLFELKLSLKTEQRKGQVKAFRAQAAEALEAKQWESAEKLADEAIRLAPTDPEILDLKGKIVEAKARAQQVKKLLARAKVAQQSRELAVAKKAVEDALALDPHDTDAKLMRSAVGKMLVQDENQRQIQQLLQAARVEIEARQFTSAQENIVKAQAIDSAYPEIAGLEHILNAGREQDARQRELSELCSRIQQELNANHAKAAREIAAIAMRKYPGEQSVVRLKNLVEATVEKDERRTYIDDRIAAASRLVEGGEANRALRLLKDIERECPTDLRLREHIEAMRQAAARETVTREKQQVLQQARTAMRGKSLGEAIRILESGLIQFPEDPEIKDLLKTGREEFDRLSKKKQLEDVTKEAEGLLQARAHTDAIRLLERTAAQVSDPELTNLLKYAREEAAKFHAAVEDASEQVNQMLSVGQASEAVTFLEAQVGKYGKNADFQVLLEQARKQAGETERAQQRLRANLNEAQAKLRSRDLQGAEALLRLCKIAAPDDFDVLALEVEVEEEKKAASRRQVGKTAKPEESDSSPVSPGRREELVPPASGPSFDVGSATVLDGGGEVGHSASPMVRMPSEGAPGVAAAAAAAHIPSSQLGSATDFLGAHASAWVDSAVLTPPPVAEPTAPKPQEKEQKRDSKKGSKKEKGKTSEIPWAGVETVITPAPKLEESVPLSMPTIVEEPEPLAPPSPPKPPMIAPSTPEPQPLNGKKPLLIAGGGLGTVLVAALLWVVLHKPQPEKVTPPPPQPQTTARSTNPPVTVTPPVEAPLLPVAEGTPVGTLVVIANVDHFTVLVDGRTMMSNSGNKKRVSVENVPEGYRKIKLTSPGFQDSTEQTVKIIAKKEIKSFLFKLEKGREAIAPPPSTAAATQPSTPSPSQVAVIPPTLEAKAASTAPPPVVAPLTKPVITSVHADSANVDAGTKVKLSWTTTGAEKVNIKPDNITGGASDSVEVEPREPSTTYELIAYGSGVPSEPKTITVKVRPKRDETAEIKKAVLRWKSAVESLDVDKLKAVWPGLTKEWIDRIGTIKKEGQRVQIEYECDAPPKYSDGGAQTTCTQTTALQGQSQGPSRSHATFVLSKKGDSWEIVNITVASGTKK